MENADRSSPTKRIGEYGVQLGKYRAKAQLLRLQRASATAEERIRIEKELQAVLTRHDNLKAEVERQITRVRDTEFAAQTAPPGPTGANCTPPDPGVLPIVARSSLNLAASVADLRFQQSKPFLCTIAQPCSRDHANGFRPTYPIRSSGAYATNAECGARSRPVQPTPSQAISCGFFPPQFYQLPSVVGYVDGHSARCFYPEVTPAQQLLNTFKRQSVLAVFDEKGICVREGRMKQSAWWCDVDYSYEYLNLRAQKQRTCLLEYLAEQKDQKKEAAATSTSVVTAPTTSAQAEQFASASSAIPEQATVSAPSTPNKSAKRKSVGERLQEQAELRKKTPVNTPDQEVVPPPTEEVATHPPGILPPLEQEEEEEPMIQDYNDIHLGE